MFKYFLKLLPDEIDTKYIYLKKLKKDKYNFFIRAWRIFQY